MTFTLLELAVALVVILAAAEIFTNALEHLGDRLDISEGVTGSLFAAVGTALPETMVPVIAILMGTNNQAMNEEIGVGAILGAPLMLATLTTFLMALAALKSRGIRGHVRPEHSGFVRDLHFFLMAFTLAALAMLVPQSLSGLRMLFSLGLVGLYITYIVLTFRASRGLVEDGHGTSAEHPMLLNRLGLPDRNSVIVAQLVLGALLLIAGVKAFIHGVEGMSQILSISPLILALLIIPIATELPEKVNSILWIRRGKDTLAFGNITGAMVFQGTLLPAIGILLTPWQMNAQILPGIAMTLLAALWLRLNARRQGIALPALMLCGIFYATYLAIALG